MDKPTRHWPFYCEENVWHLCQALPRNDAHSLVVFVSNAQRGVAMWGQRAAHAPGRAIVWDYHVFLLRQDEEGFTAIDPDTTLGAELEAGAYLDASFGPLPPGLEEFAPRFRVLPAETYRFALQSDRSHMRGPDGRYRSEPPPWPPIGEGTNLMRFVDLERPFLGRVVDLAGLREALGLS